MDRKLPPLPAQYRDDCAPDVGLTPGAAAPTALRPAPSLRPERDPQDRVTPVPAFVRLASSAAPVPSSGIVADAVVAAAPASDVAGVDMRPAQTRRLGRRLAAVCAGGVIVLSVVGFGIAGGFDTAPASPPGMSAQGEEPSGTGAPFRSDGAFKDPADGPNGHAVEDVSGATKADLEAAYAAIVAGSAGKSALIDPTADAAGLGGIRFVTGWRSALATDEIHVARSRSGDAVCLHGETSSGTWFSLAAVRMPEGSVEAHYDWSGSVPPTVSACTASAARELSTEPW